MRSEWRILSLFLRSVMKLLNTVPDGDPLRRLRAWQQVERQASFISHLLEDIGKGGR